jgi:hypothetical protein
MTIETLGQIAQVSAKLVDLIYEFERYPDLLPEAIGEHVEILDNLLTEGGYRPEPRVPTPEEVDAWIQASVADTDRDLDQ